MITMRVQQHHVLTAPLPAHLPPAAVVAALQRYTLMLELPHNFTRFEHITTQPNSLADDAFFSPWEETTRGYLVHEVVKMAPGLTKKISYCCFFQNVPDGVRCRADAPSGVKIWAEYTVRLRPADSPMMTTASPGSDSTGGTAIPDGDYEVYESAVLEANSLLLPFIARELRNAHQDLCIRLVQEVAKEYSYGPGT